MHLRRWALAALFAVFATACASSPESAILSSDPAAAATDNADPALQSVDPVADRQPDDPDRDDPAPDDPDSDDPAADDPDRDDPALQPVDPQADSDDPEAPSDAVLALLDVVPDAGIGVDDVTITRLADLISLAEITPRVREFCDENNVEPLACELLGIQGWDRASAALPAFIRDRDYDDVEQSFGFSLRNVQAAIDVPIPDRNYIAFSVDLDDQTILDRAAADDRWSPDLETREVSGFQILDWGDDIDIARRTAARTLGRGGQLAVSDGIVVRTVNSEDLSRTLDQQTGRLSDVPHIMNIAEYLNERDVLVMTFFDDPTRSEDPTIGLAPWQVAAVGVSIEQGQATGWLVHAHTSESVARENQERLERQRQLDEPGPLEIVETTVDGPYLISQIQSVEPTQQMYRLLVLDESRAGPLFGLEE